AALQRISRMGTGQASASTQIGMGASLFFGFRSEYAKDPNGIMPRSLNQQEKICLNYPHVPRVLLNILMKTGYNSFVPNAGTNGAKPKPRPLKPVRQFVMPMAMNCRMETRSRLSRT